MVLAMFYNIHVVLHIHCCPDVLKRDGVIRYLLLTPELCIFVVRLFAILGRQPDPLYALRFETKCHIPPKSWLCESFLYIVQL